MATINPALAIDRIRLSVGDYSDLPYLTDDVYQYCLDQNSANEPAATKMAAQLILAQLAYGSHQRLDKIEQYGSESFENYLKFIKQVITSPSLNATGSIYCGGMLKKDMQDNVLDDTLVQKRIINYPRDNYDDSTENLLGIESDGYDYFSNY